MAKNIKRTEVNVDAAIAGAKAFAEGAQQKEIVASGELGEQRNLEEMPEENTGSFVNEQHKDLGKVVTNEQTERCPFCKSTLLQTLPLHSYRNRRCSKCGVHFRIEPPLKQLNKTA